MTELKTCALLGFSDGVVSLAVKDSAQKQTLTLQHCQQRRGLAGLHQAGHTTPPRGEGRRRERGGAERVVWRGEVGGLRAQEAKRERVERARAVSL